MATDDSSSTDSEGLSDADTELPDETLAAAPNRRPQQLDALAGELVDRYQIIEQLGAGGMGVVYRARDTELSRDVALKLLRPRSGRSDVDMQKRLLREAQALAQVSHANLVAVFDLGTHRDQVFVVMELVKGKSLKHWLRDQKRDWREVWRVFEQAGRGLVAAHAAGLVHRDFKPDNVLIGDDGSVQVVDFGLARSVGDMADDAVDSRATTLPPGAEDVLGTPLTRTGAIMGTPAYMAPEQHQGSSVDARADQFAFAVALYEGLYGARPFRGDSLVEIVNAVTEGTIDPPPPKTAVPKRVGQALQRALAKEPRARYADMDAMLEAVGKATRRSWLLPAGAAVVVAIGCVVATMQLTADRPTLTTVMPGGNRAIQKIVRQHFKEVRDCYIKEGHGRTGRVMIEFTIGSHGRLRKFEAKDDDFRDTGLGACLGGAAMKWRFANPVGGGTIRIRYPFSFSPK